MGIPAFDFSCDFYDVDPAADLLSDFADSFSKIFIPKSVDIHSVDLEEFRVLIPGSFPSAEDLYDPPMFASEHYVDPVDLSKLGASNPYADVDLKSDLIREAWKQCIAGIALPYGGAEVCLAGLAFVNAWDRLKGVVIQDYFLMEKLVFVDGEVRVPLVEFTLSAGIRKFAIFVHSHSRVWASIGGYDRTEGLWKPKGEQELIAARGNVSALADCIDAFITKVSSSSYEWEVSGEKMQYYGDLIEEECVPRFGKARTRHRK